MHVISRKRLKEFWESDKKAEIALDEWYRRVKKINPSDIAELRLVFPHADLVGSCIVFNVGGNKYRLITKMDFRRQTVFIRYVLSHKEYDKEKWKSDCT